MRLPGCAWTGAHSAQGFARRESNVSFATLLEFGFADLVAYCGPYQPRREYQSVNFAPSLVTSDEVFVDGPEEVDMDRMVLFPPGNYQLVAAQLVKDDNEVEETIELERLAERC